LINNKFKYGIIMIQNKYYIFLVILILAGRSCADERKFKHVKGAYDFNGPEVLRIIGHASRSPLLREQLFAFVQEQYNKRFYNSYSADCSLETINSEMQKRNKASLHFDPVTKDRAYRINSLYETIGSQRNSSINWQPYITGTFTDEQGNTLLHKLAQLCDQANTQDLLVLVKEINNQFGPIGTIPARFENINGSKTGGQLVFAKGLGSIYGERLSVEVKNLHGKTALDIVDAKLQEGTYMGMFLSSSCIPCNHLKQQFEKQFREEQNAQSIPSFIRNGKK